MENNNNNNNNNNNKNFNLNDCLDIISKRIDNDLMKLYSEYNDHLLNKEKIDLSTKEGLYKYNNLIDELEKTVNENKFFKTFIDDETFEALKEIGNDIHKKSNNSKKNIVEEKEVCDKNCSECELDYCIHEDVIDLDEDDNDNECNKNCACTCRKEVDNTCGEDFSIPSDRIKNIDIKLQIHRLTQKYVDEMVKPYLGKDASTKQINDAYSALYEFACWIYSQK